ncbi:MAG: putative N-acetylglucosamine kinase [Bacteroidota bacterium]|jgi:N-acetylglucosamine kinase-like BadF-type ATPase|nr:putative N-acetylglucosamine kinase [Bacteroidota bacterium]
MILIADSGSTKTDWRLIDNKNNTYNFHTIGFNPYFQDSTSIARELNTHLEPSISALQLDQEKEFNIYFYGAGCSSTEKCDIVKTAISEVFPNADIFVEHDLLAAARALCGNTEGIAAIMGTGSNSCYYDGNKIAANVSSLGYILGDEGSGAYIGKHFIQDYLNKELPAKIADSFDATYNLSKEKILNAVYKEPMPSRFLASFSKFINQNKHEEYFKDLVKFNFNQFFVKHICKYDNHQKVHLSCVGSVAFHYRDTLQEVANSKGVQLNKVIDSPITDLTKFHLNK